MRYRIRIFAVTGAAIIFGACCFMPAFAYLDSSSIMAFGSSKGAANPANIVDIGETPVFISDSYDVASNDMIPAASYFSKFRGPNFSGSQAHAKLLGRYGVMMAMNGWAAGYSKYQAADVVLAGDTARFLQDLKFNRFTTGKVYKLEISSYARDIDSMQFMASRGFKLMDRDLSMGVSFSLLTGNFYHEGGASGTITTVNSNTNAILVNVVDRFGNKSEDTGAYGEGFCFDFGAKYAYSDNVEFEMILDNLVGSITWNNIYFLDATGDTDNITTDAQGIVIRNPTITGREKHENVIEILEVVPVYGVNYHSGNTKLSSFIEPHTDTIFYALGADIDYKSHSFFFGYSSKYSGATAGMRLGGFSLGLVANNISVIDAQTVGVLLSMAY